MHIPHDLQPIVGYVRFNTHVVRLIMHKGLRPD
jgi:hypothetical protein